VKTRKPQRSDGEPVDLDLDRSARFLSAELPPRAELLYIAGVTAIGYLVAIALDWSFLRLIAKPWPVVALARWVLLEARERNRPELKTVAYALFFGATGDLLLELGPRTFLFGAGAFLCGHLLYAHALHRETAALHPVRALPGLAFAGGMVAILWPEVDARLGVAFAVYGLALAGVIFRAAARVGSPTVDPLWARLGLLGAVVFAVSDAVLAVDRFHTPIAGARRPEGHRSLRPAHRANARRASARRNSARGGPHGRSGATGRGGAAERAERDPTERPEDERDRLSSLRGSSRRAR
jgi:alkenylglycerophosphocholine hydrolase